MEHLEVPLSEDDVPPAPANRAVKLLPLWPANPRAWFTNGGGEVLAAGNRRRAVLFLQLPARPPGGDSGPYCRLCGGCPSLSEPLSPPVAAHQLLIIQIGTALNPAASSQAGGPKAGPPEGPHWFHPGVSCRGRLSRPPSQEVCHSFDL